MSTNIQKVGVCGAGGTMGAGIAIVASRAGFETACFDTSMEVLDRARGQNEGFFGKFKSVEGQFEVLEVSIDCSRGVNMTGLMLGVMLGVMDR